MKENLLKIINHFGINNQQRKLNEEVFELQEAITKFEQASYNDFDGKFDKKELLENGIKEELADMCVILRQIIEYYRISEKEITEIMINKTERTLERIEKGYYER